MIDEIRSTARSYFPAETNPAHDWFHVQRVEANAVELAAEYPDADVRVVRLSALLHDVGRVREDRGEIDDHAEWGADESARLLDEWGADDDTIDGVTHCVRAHRYSTDVEPETIEAKVLSDADNLDALGAVGVARCFAYGGENGVPMYDPSLPPEADPSTAGETTFDHLHEKILDLPNRMYTDAGRERADDRSAFVREFARRFEREASGTR